MIQKNLWWFATAAAATNGEQDFGNTQLALLLATEPDKEIHVYHMPHGTSKRNKVEYRLFCYITKNREGKSLLEVKAAVNYIRSTKKKSDCKACCGESMLLIQANTNAQSGFLMNKLRQ